METLFQQLYAFAVTIVAGAAMGVVFDVFRALRSSAQPRSLLTWVSDILYWVAVTPVVAGLLLHANWGELRFYVVLGMALGLVLYFVLLSPVVLEVLFFIGRSVSYIVSTVIHIVWTVVVWPIMFARNVGHAWRARGGLGFNRAAAPRHGWMRWPWRPSLAWRRR